MRPPDDTLPFDALAAQYNFGHPTERKRVFSRLLAEECRRRPRPVRAIDIGCGKGIELDLSLTRQVRECVDELWGIEPDPGIKHDTSLFTHYQTALLETAQLPDNYFDIAYSFMVIEHVQQPEAFMRTVHRVLKPGGVHMFGTINAAHYFARIAGSLRKLRLDETILRMVRGKVVEEYHYPVAYKFNTTRVIDAAAKRLGFEPPEYVFLEQDGPKPYFPGPLRPFLWGMNWKRATFRDPRALLVMVCRMTKSST